MTLLLALFALVATAVPIPCEQDSRFQINRTTYNNATPGYEYNCSNGEAVTVVVDGTGMPPSTVVNITLYEVPSGILVLGPVPLSFALILRLSTLNLVTTNLVVVQSTSASLVMDIQNVTMRLQASTIVQAKSVLANATLVVQDAVVTLVENSRLLWSVSSLATPSVVSTSTNVTVELFASSWIEVDGQLLGGTVVTDQSHVVMLSSSSWFFCSSSLVNTSVLLTNVNTSLTESRWIIANGMLQGVVATVQSSTIALWNSDRGGGAAGQQSVFVYCVSHLNSATITIRSSSVSLYASTWAYSQGNIVTVDVVVRDSTIDLTSRASWFLSDRGMQNRATFGATNLVLVLSQQCVFAMSATLARFTTTLNLCSVTLLDASLWAQVGPDQNDVRTSMFASSVTLVDESRWFALPRNPSTTNPVGTLVTTLQRASVTLLRSSYWAMVVVATTLDSYLIDRTFVSIVNGSSWIFALGALATITLSSTGGGGGSEILVSQHSSFATAAASTITPGGTGIVLWSELFLSKIAVTVSGESCWIRCPDFTVSTFVATWSTDVQLHLSNGSTYFDVRNATLDRLVFTASSLELHVLNGSVWCRCRNLVSPSVTVALTQGTTNEVFGSSAMFEVLEDAVSGTLQLNGPPNPFALPSITSAVFAVGNASTLLNVSGDMSQFSVMVSQAVEVHLNVTTDDTRWLSILGNASGVSVGVAGPAAVYLGPAIAFIRVDARVYGLTVTLTETNLLLDSAINPNAVLLRVGGDVVSGVAVDMAGAAVSVAGRGTAAVVVVVVVAPQSPGTAASVVRLSELSIVCRSRGALTLANGSRWLRFVQDSGSSVVPASPWNADGITFLVDLDSEVRLQNSSCLMDAAAVSISNIGVSVSSSSTLVLSRWSYVVTALAFSTVSVAVVSGSHVVVVNSSALLQAAVVVKNVTNTIMSSTVDVVTSSRWMAAPLIGAIVPSTSNYTILSNSSSCTANASAPATPDEPLNNYTLLNCSRTVQLPLNTTEVIDASSTITVRDSSVWYAADGALAALTTTVTGSQVSVQDSSYWARVSDGPLALSAMSILDGSSVIVSGNRSSWFSAPSATALLVAAKSAAITLNESSLVTVVQSPTRSGASSVDGIVIVLFATDVDLYASSSFALLRMGVISSTLVKATLSYSFTLSSVVLLGEPTNSSGWLVHACDAGSVSVSLDYCLVSFEVDVTQHAIADPVFTNHPATVTSHGGFLCGTRDNNVPERNYSNLPNGPYTMTPNDLPPPGAPCTPKAWHTETVTVSAVQLSVSGNVTLTRLSHSITSSRSHSMTLSPSPHVTHTPTRSPSLRTRSHTRSVPLTPTRSPPRSRTPRRTLTPTGEASVSARHTPSRTHWLSISARTLTLIPSRSRSHLVTLSKPTIPVLSITVTRSSTRLPPPRAYEAAASGIQVAVILAAVAGWGGRNPAAACALIPWRVVQCSWATQQSVVDLGWAPLSPLIAAIAERSNPSEEPLDPLLEGLIANLSLIVVIGWLLPFCVVAFVVPVLHCCCGAPSKDVSDHSAKVSPTPQRQGSNSGSSSSSCCCEDECPSTSSDGSDEVRKSTRSTSKKKKQRRKQRDGHSNGQAERCFSALHSALAKGRIPGMSLVLAEPLLFSTAAAAVSCVWEPRFQFVRAGGELSPPIEGRLAVGIAGLVVVGVDLIGVMWFTVRLTHFAQPMPLIHEPREVYRRWVTADTSYEPKKENAAIQWLLDAAYIPLFSHLSWGRRWFLILELGLLVGMSLLLSVATVLPASSGCVVAQWLLAILASGWAILVLVSRPHIAFLLTVVELLHHATFAAALWLVTLFSFDDIRVILQLLALVQCALVVAQGAARLLVLKGQQLQQIKRKQPRQQIPSAPPRDESPGQLLVLPTLQQSSPRTATSSEPHRDSVTPTERHRPRPNCEEHRKLPPDGRKREDSQDQQRIRRPPHPLHEVIRRQSIVSAKLQRDEALGRLIEQICDARRHRVMLGWQRDLE